MVLTLYQHPVSSQARSVTLFLNAINAKYVSVMIDLQKGAQNEPSYAEINPMKKVPAIVHDGFKLSQSPAILQYLAGALPDVPDHWYPTDLKVRARIDEYMVWHEADGIHPVSMFMLVVMPQLSKTPVDTVELNKRAETMGKGLDHLENHFLKDKDFIAGSTISIADCVGVSQMMQTMSVGYPVTKGRPRIEAWINRCKAKLQPVFEPAHEPLLKFTAPLKWDFKLD